MIEIGDLAAMQAEKLNPELAACLVETDIGFRMIKHPLVYDIGIINGLANRMLVRKKAALADALDRKDWHSVVFLHERAYRLWAFIEYVTGRDEYDLPLPVDSEFALLADVWVDSENIEENLEDWRALLCNYPWLGNLDEQAAFDALPDPIPAWRGGTVGDWSWTTDQKIAQFFARRSGHEPRQALIPKADVFGYLTRRGESELLVRLTLERAPLVYPNGMP